jgi:hypothetical protein
VHWAIGASIHLCVTFIEQHLWKSGRLSVFWIIFLVGLWDVATNTIGLQGFFSQWGAAVTDLPWIAGLTLAALFIAIIPERQAAASIESIWHILHRR